MHDNSVSCHIMLSAFVQPNALIGCQGLAAVPVAFTRLHYKVKHDHTRSLERGLYFIRTVLLKWWDAPSGKVAKRSDESPDTITDTVLVNYESRYERHTPRTLDLNQFIK